MTRILSIVLLILILAGCQTLPAATATTRLTDTPVPSETPPPTSTATQTSTPTVVPTATTSPATLEQQAAELCDRAFSAPVQNQQFDMPYLGMLKTERDRNPRWKVSNTTPHLFALSAESVKSIVCRLETKRQAGIYTDGSAAFKVTMNIRVVSWPDGTVVASQIYESGDPPKTKTGIGGGYGSYPEGMNVRDWLEGQFRHPKVLSGHNAIAVAPQGGMAATVIRENESQKILLFDWSSLSTIATLENNGLDSVIDLEFSPDGAFLISIGTDQLARFWDMQTYQQSHEVPFNGRPRSAVFSPDGRTMAISTDDGIHLMRVEEREIHLSLPSDPLVGNLAFSQDSTQILINGPLNDEMGIMRGINVMDVETGEGVSLFPDLSSVAFSFSPEAGISFDAEFPTNIGNFALSPDGGTLVAFNSNEIPNIDNVTGLPVEGEHKLEVWNAGTGQYLFDIPYTGLPARIIVYAPSGNSFAMGSAAGISIWNTDTWTVVKKLVGHVGDITDLAFTQDSNNVISTSADGTVRVWSLVEVE